VSVTVDVSIEELVEAYRILGVPHGASATVIRVG
jgi:hypothetical protein